MLVYIELYMKCLNLCRSVSRSRERNSFIGKWGFLFPRIGKNSPNLFYFCRWRNGEKCRFLDVQTFPISTSSLSRNTEFLAFCTFLSTAGLFFFLLFFFTRNVACYSSFSASFGFFFYLICRNGLEKV